MTQIKPYKESELSKKGQVGRMFDRIAPRYDFLNHLLSLGIDRRWREKVARIVKKNNPSTLLDVATGTGDLAITLARRVPGCAITGSDLSAGMLEVGRAKVARTGLGGRIALMQADAENLPLADDSFDVVTAAFGVRNFENLEQGLREMNRVLRPGGMVCILEFSMPSNRFVRWAYRLYFMKVLPGVGGFFSRDRNAYRYLPRSVDVFPSGKSFLSLMAASGFGRTTHRQLMTGIASIYCGYKEQST